MDAIFVSYAREDARSAKLIVDRLRHEGFPVFFDQDRIHAGPFAEQLAREIARCRVFLLLVSAA